MAADLIGPIRQLIAVLRRRFRPDGSPPEMPCWTYPVSDSRKSDEGVTGHTATFRALLDEKHEDAFLIEAIREIPPLREIAEVLKAAAHALETTANAHRLKYLFQNVLSFRWVASTSNQTTHFLNDPVEHRFGYGFAEFEESALSELREACDEICEVVQPKADKSLTDSENIILEALGDKTLTGAKLATAAGFPNNSQFRNRLSQLVKRGLLENPARKGYRRKQ